MDIKLTKVTRDRLKKVVKNQDQNRSRKLTRLTCKNIEKVFLLWSLDNLLGNLQTLLYTKTIVRNVYL